MITADIQLVEVETVTIIVADIDSIQEMVGPVPMEIVGLRHRVRLERIIIGHDLTACKVGVENKLLLTINAIAVPKLIDPYIIR